jgi:hypothetical protein
MFFVAHYLFHCPRYIFRFSLAPDGAIGHAAIMAAIRQTRVGMDEKFCRDAGFLIYKFFYQFYLGMHPV